MTRRLDDAIRGRWWRRADYRFDGAAIRPVDGSGLEVYDPWAQYRLRPLSPRERGRRTNAGRPYLRLIELLESLRGIDDALEPKNWHELHDAGETPELAQLSVLSPRSRERVLSWCSANGLLGLLPHRALEMSVAAGPEEMPSTVYRYVPGRGWLEQPVLPRELPRVRRPARAGAPARIPKVARPTYVTPERAEAVVRSLTGAETEFASTDKLAADYFDRRNPARPTSDPFWESYGEPWEEFHDAAELLRWIVRTVADPNPGLTESERAHEIARAVRALNDLTGGVTTTVVADDDGYHYELISPSLLASYTQMIKQDIVGRRIRTCQWCRSLFISASSRTLYCTGSCKEAAAKKRQRSRPT